MPYSTKLVRETIQEQISEKRSEKTVDSTPRQGGAHSRGDTQLLELIRQTSNQNLMLYKYNDMTDHDIDVAPGEILEQLNTFNCEYFEGNLEVVPNFEKQHIKVLNKSENLEVKIKFFELEREDEDEEEEDEDTFEFNKRLRMRLVKKKGDIASWYQLFDQMRATVFEGLLLAP